MISDYHVHSCFSFDSKEKPENIINQAISLGMKQICFTDHQDFNWPVDGESPLLNIKEYVSTLSALREKYNHKIQVLTGIELGLMNGNESLCQELLTHNDFDYVIGSCHIVDGMDPYYSSFWKGKPDRIAFESYFKTLLDGLKAFHNIETLGHLDYIVRYSPNKEANYSPLDYMDVIDEILKFIVSKEIKLEINTSNLAKGFSFPNPHMDIVKRYKELGGEYVVFGSDAHTTEGIGYAFNETEKTIREIGLKIFVL